MADETEPGKRDRPPTDRRRTPTSPWQTIRGGGQRVRARRTHEHAQPYFVDRFTAPVLAWILLLLVACLVDAALTLRLIEAGGTEINPLMKHLLDYGIMPFLFGKYVLTVMGLPLLLIYKNHFLLGTRFRIGHLFPLFVVAYAALLLYQACLLQIHHC